MKILHSKYYLKIHGKNYFPDNKEVLVFSREKRECVKEILALGKKYKKILRN